MIHHELDATHGWMNAHVLDARSFAWKVPLDATYGIIHSFVISPMAAEVLF